jgi:CRP/FNR family cyclic AMP-dependent transcriptional regulator
MEQTNLLRKAFVSAKHKHVYPKGTIIVMQGTSLHEAFFIEKGIVRVCDFDRQGSQHIVAILTKNYIFPFNWLLDDMPSLKSLSYYQAATEVVCYTVDVEEAKRLINNDFELSSRLLNMMTKSYFNSISRIQNLQKTNVEEKVDFIINYLTILLGEKTSGKIYKLDSQFTHQDVADLAGLTRESVSRQLKKTKYKQMMMKKEGGMIIDLSGLSTDKMPPIFSVSP